MEVDFVLLFGYCRAMPSFTAFALDRLLEPGASKSVDKSVPPGSSPAPRPNNLPKPPASRRPNLERGNSVPASTASHPSLERTSSVPTLERKVSRPQISPALYATPEATPLPDSPSDSPSSFPPSPYIVNHKRRGPRLSKSFSEVDVAARKKALEEDKANDSGKDEEEAKATGAANGCSVTFTIEGDHLNGVVDIQDELVNGERDCPVEVEGVNGVQDSEIGSSDGKLGSNGTRKNLTVDKDGSLNLEKDGECEDFYDPQDSMSYASNTDGEDNGGAESSMKYPTTTPAGEFYDAWDELSTESERQTSLRDVDAELCELRLGLLTEIEKRKQAEEALKNMQSQWQRIRQELAIVGLRLPACPVDIAEADEMDANPAEELLQQLSLARIVSESIGRGMAKAEMEVEMESQIEAKNFEIARLLDRLHYYEAVNREMSQRNQEAVEMGRRNRLSRKRRQRWVWGSIAAAITLGTAALAWSYLPSARGSSASDGSSAVEHNEAAKK
ncbi:hypothetical protein Tsubulata_000301 [Turnera subulata]|uniref:Uncharacterized protein n=1 Tax=Turnera subulata TaxID=218843 RepID=A0A9Q0F0W4_9ROSI|nr:hypothetical protein Tsubulata_000301 [Turnera subulata]